MTDDLIEQLMKARELVMQEGEAPENMYHPKYGWILIDGEPTENAATFYEDYLKSLEK